MGSFHLRSGQVGIYRFQIVKNCLRCFTKYNLHHHYFILMMMLLLLLLLYHDVQVKRQSQLDVPIAVLVKRLRLPQHVANVHQPQFH